MLTLCYIQLYSTYIFCLPIYQFSVIFWKTTYALNMYTSVFFITYVNYKNIIIKYISLWHKINMAIIDKMNKSLCYYDRLKAVLKDSWFLEVSKNI